MLFIYSFMKHQHDSANIGRVESTFSIFLAWRQDIRYFVFVGLSYYQDLQLFTFVHHNITRFLFLTIRLFLEGSHLFWTTLYIGLTIILDANDNRNVQIIESYCKQMQIFLILLQADANLFDIRARQIKLLKEELFLFFIKNLFFVTPTYIA